MNDQWKAGQAQVGQGQALFLDIASLYPADLNLSGLEAVANWQWFDNVAPADIQHSLSEAEIIVTNKIVLDSEIIAACAQLKLICVAATGVNNVDVQAAKRQSVSVCNVRGYATDSVVQHVFAMLLSLNRKLGSYQQSARNGDWARSEFFCYLAEPFEDLAGKTLGIIGYGELGRAVAKVAEGFGMDVLIARRPHSAGSIKTAEQRVELDALLAASDVVSLHCPLTRDNYGLIDERALALMKPGAVLVNTARGGLVDEQALLRALRAEHIAAALDVLEEEPPPLNHGLLSYRGDNLIVTPHVAWASRSSRQRLVDEIAKNIRCFQQGQARNII